jgi:hypothetical protein
MKKILIIVCFLGCFTQTNAQTKKNDFQILRDSLLTNHNYIHEVDGYLVYKKSNISVEEIELINLDHFGNTTYKKKITCSLSDKPVELNEYQEKTLYDILKHK